MRPSLFALFFVCAGAWMLMHPGGARAQSSVDGPSSTGEPIRPSQLTQSSLMPNIGGGGSTIHPSTSYTNYPPTSRKLDIDSARWVQHKIAVSSQHYIGVEFGMTQSYMLGAHNFYFPGKWAGPGVGVGSAPASLPFSSLGNGQGMEFGGTIDFSLSDIIGLQGKLRYFDNVLSHEERTSGNYTTAAGDVIPGELVTSYSTSRTFIGADAFMRYQIVPQKYYAIGGVGISIPVAESFQGERHLESSGKSLLLADSTLHGLQDVNANQISSDNYYRTFRADLRFGFGTFLPVTEDLVVTPELVFSVPLTTVFSKQTEAAYQAAGVSTPRLWQVTASFTFKFPNGGFSLYEIERDRLRRYREALLREKVKHPMPPLKQLNLAVRDSRVKADTLIAAYDTLGEMPDYEVDNQGRLIRWGDLGTAVGKRRLTVNFEFGKSELPSSSIADLDRLAKVMTKHPMLQSQIAAYTDARGPLYKNMELSQQRALAVRAYLASKGLSPERLPAKGFGPAFPVASNDTAEGRALNRRVEFVITSMSASNDQ
ncbi:MAG: OmpA family protein [Candidatus Kapaibacterium sp.]|jgi:outer membrane protein OmpA-like peptidoglycan-associated protein